MTEIVDQDVRILAGLAAALEPDYAPSPDDPWEGSPFQWILRVPSRTKGAVGEALVAGWCAAKGFDVIRARNSDADRIVHGHRVEIKMSTPWRMGGYKFQQIRDQEYDYCFCLGISPINATRGCCRSRFSWNMSSDTWVSILAPPEPMPRGLAFRWIDRTNG